MAFFDHYTHLYKILRHQLSYMQLYNTQHAYSPVGQTLLRVPFQGFTHALHVMGYTHNTVIVNHKTKRLFESIRIRPIIKSNPQSFERGATALPTLP